MHTAPGSSPSDLRVGYGEDAHRLEAGRALVIGGVTVPAPRGAVGHSDGDVLLHALSDSLLAAFALGDIGVHFPPGDPTKAGLDSRAILARALQLVAEAAPGYGVVNCAAVVTLDEPRLGPFRERIAGACSELLGIPAGDFGLTFKTSEGLAQQHVQARVVTLLGRPGR